MVQVSVGLVPVCTTVGTAVSVPTGTDGEEVARDLAGIRAQMVVRAAETAARWLVFMAGCKGGMSGNTFRLGPQKRDFF